MVLNYIWVAFFIVAFVIALVKLVFWGDFEVFPAMMDSTFSSSKTAFEISLGLTGVLALWLGIMKIGEKGGVVNVLARILSPVFTKLFPDIPKGHPVTGSIFMNIAANMLGLDNAATPLGLKAMEQLKEIKNEEIKNQRDNGAISEEKAEDLKVTATNPMIMFLVLNTSGLTLIPISIMVYRSQMGDQPAESYDAAHPRRCRYRCGRHHLGLWTARLHTDEQGEHNFSQHHADDNHHRLYSSWPEEEGKCLRCLYRGRKGGIPDSSEDYPVSGGYPRWYRRFSCLRCDGYAYRWHQMGRRGLWRQFRLRRCSANGSDEASIR